MTSFAIPAPTAAAFAREPLAIGEYLAFLRERAALVQAFAAAPRADVLVLPGFLSGDYATAPLRGVLNDGGHRARGWKLGRNLGLRPGRYEALEARFLDVARGAGRPLVLIGWSLGGLYAAELARRYPEAVAHLFTLGSPVSGQLRANRAWPLYERVAGHAIDAAPVDWLPGALPGVPFTAIAAEGDGIVSPLAARAPAGPGVENVSVPGTHCGLGWNGNALRAIAERLPRS